MLSLGIGTGGAPESHPSPQGTGGQRDRGQGEAAVLPFVQLMFGLGKQQGREQRGGTDPHAELSPAGTAVLPLTPSLLGDISLKEQVEFGSGISNVGAWQELDRASPKRNLEYNFKSTKLSAFHTQEINLSF